jgi:hypothetical protein
MKYRECLPSQQERTLATLLVMVIDRKGVGVQPPPSPARAEFSITMGCTPEIGHCHSMCTLWLNL